jgi:hypothetical protein
MPWVLAAAAVGVGGTLLASNNASKAADSAAQAQQQASAASVAENARQFDTIQANNAPYRQVGNSAISALGGAFGLPGYGAAPSMTQGVASTPVPGVGGISMSGVRSSDNGALPMDRATGVPDGSQGFVGGKGSTPTMTGGAALIDGQPPGVWDAYLAANPDVAAWAAAGHGDPSLGPNQTPEQAAAYQYQNTGQSEGRTLPPAAPDTSTAPSMTGSGGYVAPPGYADPTAPNGYDAGARPTPAATPPQFTPGTLNVGLDAYQKSPDYNFRLQQGQNALDHVASSMGGVMSGARYKAADRYNQDYATTDYNNWRDYTTNRYDTANQFGNLRAQEAIGQSNADRARSDGLYQDDRSFLSGQYNNRSGQLMTLAGFGSNANAQNANAAASFASSDAALRGTAATATGNAAISGANAFTSGVNNLMTTGAYLGGQYLTANPASYYGVNPSFTGSSIGAGASNLMTSGAFNYFPGG